MGGACNQKLEGAPATKGTCMTTSVQGGHCKCMDASYERTLQSDAHMRMQQYVNGMP